MAEDRGRRRSGLQGSKTLLVYTRTNILYIIFMYMLATLVCILILLAAERETAVYIYNCVIASSSMGGGVEWVMCWGGVREDTTSGETCTIHIVCNAHYSNTVVNDRAICFHRYCNIIIIVIFPGL